MSNTHDSVTASDAITSKFKAYGDYTIESKFPHAVDGLKQIHRRILWKLHLKPDTRKEATLTGEVMEMHPHGDTSISDAIAKMAQPFSNLVPLVFSDSQIGNYAGAPPSAPRYVDVSEAEFSRDVFFKDVNVSTFNMIPCGTESGIEPEFLIPVIPTALLIGTFGVAVGFKSETPSIPLKNVCLLTKEYIRLRTTAGWDRYKNTLVKYLIPDFPVEGLLRNERELYQAYRHGKFDEPVVTDGIIEIMPDGMDLVTLPFNRSFGDITYNVGETQLDKDSWATKYFQQMDDNVGKKEQKIRGRFSCKVRRGDNPFDILEEFKKNFRFSSSWKPSLLFTENGSMVQVTPFDLLDKWYTARYRSVLGELKQKQNRLLNTNRELMALILVNDHADELHKLFRSVQEKEETVPILTKRYNLTIFQARFIARLSLADMTARGRAELLSALEANKKQISEIQHLMLDVPNLMINAVDKIEKKYADKYPRVTKTPNFIGYVAYKQTGFIQCESIKEMERHIQIFGEDNVSVELYQAKGELCSPGYVNKDVSEYPKQFKADILRKMPNKALYTACFVSRGMYLYDGIIPSQSPDMRVMPIEKTFYYLTDKGMIHKINADPDLFRKALNATLPTIPTAIYAKSIDSDDVIVIHGNSKEPNVIRMDRVSDGKISRTAMGDWLPIGIYPANCPCMFTVPQECRWRTPIRHIYLQKPSDLVEKGKITTIQLGKKLIGDRSMELLNRRGFIWATK